MDTCAVCTHSKNRTYKLYGELQSLPTPTKPWADILLDFIVGLPRSRLTPKGKKKMQFSFSSTALPTWSGTLR